MTLLTPSKEQKIRIADYLRAENATEPDAKPAEPATPAQDDSK